MPLLSCQVKQSRSVELGNFASSNLLWIAVIVSTLAAALILILIALICMLRWSFNSERQNYEIFSNEWFPIFAKVIIGEPPIISKELNQTDKLILLRLWIYWHQSISGDASGRLKKFISDIGCNEVALNLIHKGNRAQKLLSSISLGNLNESSAWDYLKLLVATDDQIISLHAARAMLQLDSQRAINELMPMILGRAKWDMSVLTHILKQSRAVFESEVVKGWITFNESQKIRALKLCTNLGLSLTEEMLCQLLKIDQGTPLLNETLHLLERLQNPAYRLQIIKLFDHPSASVRAQAVRAHTAIASPRDIEILIEMLHDNDSLTRNPAAFTLSQSSTLGIKGLRSLREALEDPRAYQAVAVTCMRLELIA